MCAPEIPCDSPHPPDRISPYSYDTAGDLKQQVHVDYTNSTTTTLSYNWTWFAGANRLTTFTATDGCTTTFDYDTIGRISRRYTALGYSDYSYEGSTDWLVRETWHSAVSGAVFDLVRYRYTNGRPSYAEIAQSSSDLSAVSSYDKRYLQANWHGDIVRRVWLNGDASTEMSYDPWGNTMQTGVSRNYYGWDGGWGI